VVDRVTGDPIAEAEVSIQGLRVESVGVMPVRQRATSGADGRFRLAGVPEGGTSLLVRAAGYHARIVGGLDVREEESAGSVRVELSPAEPDDEPRVELDEIGAVAHPPDTGMQTLLSVLKPADPARSAVAFPPSVMRD
jgi:hypothetical protein